MPGVPSSRGCEACRKQKKKCDQVKPLCGRCLRLNIACVGSGFRRYKFKEDHRFTSVQISTMPGNGKSLLTSALVGKLKASDDLRYHLTWAYGGFMEDIPKRIGTNEALDTAVEALVSSHASLGSHRSGGSLALSEGLMKYSRALKTLRFYLDDFEKARTAETLCAVMLLLICQSFLGTYRNRWSSHGEGAARILKARAYYNRHDDFECKLILSLRGPVLFEAICNTRISFSPEEWTDLIESELDGTTSEGLMMSCLARVPDLLLHGRIALQEQGDLGVVIAKTRHQYLILTAMLTELHNLFSSVEKLPDNIRERVRSYYQRSYGLGLSICIIFNCILKALEPMNANLDIEAARFCQEILDLAQKEIGHRPLGAAYISLCLVAAWCVNRDEATHGKVEMALFDYMGDFPGNLETLKSEIEFASRRLSLLEP
ncbi:hypothetical protein LSUE1_G003918 [Lachnellula suecica]|uniref:Zn(2)-C6 fungal-type domain-containing protein n=1 Tax=Lachnellula suecica TaxID=602035 RepID=A0A8T9C3Q1_9HELO|nr:hypothetical protein LSUE1_G003918 [Lachnellula suecica]